MAKFHKIKPLFLPWLPSYLYMTEGESKAFSKYSVPIFLAFGLFGLLELVSLDIFGHPIFELVRVLVYLTTGVFCFWLILIAQKNKPLVSTSVNEKAMFGLTLLFVSIILFLLVVSAKIIDLSAVI